MALVVTRHCYLALRRASRLLLRRTGVVTIHEPGRSLDNYDVERVLGAPVLAELQWDASIARAVDAGLLTPIPGCAAGRIDQLNAALFARKEASPQV